MSPLLPHPSQHLTNHPFSTATSLHSRSAKRAASPSLNLDKSLTSLQRPSDHPEILAPVPNAGITKRKSKGKSFSRAQRLRQEKGMEKAEAVVGKMEVKVEKAAGKGKKGRERRKEWEEVNGGVGGKKKAGGKGEKEEDDEGWEDEDMEVEGEDGVALLAKAVTAGVGGRVVGGEVVWGVEIKEVEAEIL
jgi:hypothetical protein